MACVDPAAAAAGVRASARRGIVVATLLASLAWPLAPLAAAPPSDDEEIRAELAALRKRMDLLEARLAARAAQAAAPARLAAGPPAGSVPPPTLAALPPKATVQSATGQTVSADRSNREPGELPLNPSAASYWRVPGSDTLLRFSGMIRIGAYKDLIDNIGSYKFRSGYIHPRGDPLRNQTGNIQAAMRLTRINFDSRTPTRLGELYTTLGVDFFGGEPNNYQAEALQQNGYHFRLTHAYATLGAFDLFGIPSELLIGQTWSNFLDDPDTAESIDASGPAGVPSERQPQLRYTARLGAHAISVAIENPIGDYQLAGTAAASSVNNVSNTNRWPDLTIKYETQQPWGHAQVAGVLRLFDVDDGLGHRAAATGYGMVAGATLDLAGSDRIGGQIWFGEGIGKYVPDEFGTPNGFAVSGYGTAAIAAVTQRSYGGSIWYRHFWARNLRSNLALGYAGEGYARFVVPAIDQAPRIKTAQINLFYVPIPMLDVGVELQWGEKSFRRALGLDDADALRLAFTSRIKFN